MANQLVCFCTFIVLVLASAGSTAIVDTCTRNPVIFLMGDSNSDTGGFGSVRGMLDPYPYGRTFPSENLTATYLTHYLDSLQANFTNGVNFAVAGAKTTNDPYGLDVQLLQLKRLQNVSAELEYRGFIELGQGDFKNGLYVIDIGQNDIASHNYTDSATVIEQTIKSIYQLGGRSFWVHNTGPIGCLPTALESHKVNSSSEYDEHGCIISLNEDAKAFNSELDARCQEMRVDLTDATIVLVDIYTIKYDLIANYGVYGFVNPLKACCEHCSTTMSSLCPEGSRYLSWDGIHYTEAANSVVASKILSTTFSQPPLPINFFVTN